MMDLNNAERRIIRGEILKILKISYPDGVSNKLLLSTLGRMDMDEGSGILRGHCEYLQGKKYLAVQDVDFGDIHYICKITENGIDLLEGNIDPDPGVDI